MHGNIVIKYHKFFLKIRQIERKSALLHNLTIKIPLSVISISKIDLYF